MAHGTRIRDAKSRLFYTLYNRRYRKVTKTTWFLDNGAKKHEIVLTNVSEDFIFKCWSWFEGPK